MRNRRPCLTVLSVLLAVTLIGWRPTTTSAGQAHLQRLDEVAGRITTVLRVKALEVATSQENMKLEGGAEGPMLRSHRDFQCQVIEVVHGKWDLEKGQAVRLRHTLSSGAKYDEKGTVVAVVSYSLPFSGLETDLKAGDEFLACLSNPGVETDRQFLYRAEKPEGRGEVLAAISQARAWELFKRTHADVSASVLLAAFDAKTGRLALLVDAENRPVYLVNAADGSIRKAKTHLVATMNQIYFDESHVVLRNNDETPRPIPFSEFK